MKRIALLLILMSCGGWSLQAHAAGSCTVTTASGTTLVDFGPYTSVSGNVDGTGQFNFLCLPILPALTVTYALSISAGNAASFNPRKLTSGGYGLNYNMYLDPSHTQILGDGTSGTSKATGSCAATCVVNVYGRIFGGQALPAGIYTDSVVITLDF